VTALLQESTPDRASVPPHEIATDARYQPALLGGRAGVATVFGATVS
jgi:hypothetical protein